MSFEEFSHKPVTVGMCNDSLYGFHNLPYRYGARGSTLGHGEVWVLYMLGMSPRLGMEPGQRAAGELNEI